MPSPNAATDDSPTAGPSLDEILDNFELCRQDILNRLSDLDLDSVTQPLISKITHQRVLTDQLKEAIAHIRAEHTRQATASTADQHTIAFLRNFTTNQTDKITEHEKKITHLLADRDRHAHSLERIYGIASSTRTSTLPTEESTDDPIEEPTPTA